MRESAWHGKIEEPLTAVRRQAEAGPLRLLHNGGRVCTCAYLRGKSILYATFSMTEIGPRSAKSIPSKISMVRYLEAQTHTPTRTGNDALTHTRTHTLVQMHTARAHAQERGTHV